MSYEVVRRFFDRESGKLYEAGEVYPRRGLVASKGRIARLIGNGNAAHMQLIKEVPDKGPEPAVDHVEEPERQKRGRKKKAVDPDDDGDLRIPEKLF